MIDSLYSATDLLTSSSVRDAISKDFLYSLTFLLT
nr:MAG TPA: hypothetical protein [Bacteriophage sp.]